MKEVSLGSDMAKSVEYTGFVLDPAHEGTKRLKEMVPEEWKEYAHHMTMIPPTEMKQRLPSEQSFEGCLKVVGIAQNDKVIAAKVDLGEELLYFKIEGLPHVTIATAVDPERTSDPKNPVYYSPRLSNEFTEEDFSEPADFKICGKVEEVPIGKANKKVGDKEVVYPKISEPDLVLEEATKQVGEPHTAPNGDIIFPLRPNEPTHLVVFYHGTTGQAPVLEQLGSVGAGTTFLIPNGRDRSYDQVKATIAELESNHGVVIAGKSLGAWSGGSKGFVDAAGKDVFEKLMLADPSPNSAIMQKVPSDVYMEYNPNNWTKNHALWKNFPELVEAIKANSGIAVRSDQRHKIILKSILDKLK